MPVHLRRVNTRRRAHLLPSFPSSRLVALRPLPHTNSLTQPISAAPPNSQRCCRSCPAAWASPPPPRATRWPCKPQCLAVCWSGRWRGPSCRALRHRQQTLRGCSWVWRRLSASTSSGRPSGCRWVGVAHGGLGGGWLVAACTPCGRHHSAGQLIKANSVCVRARARRAAECGAHEGRVACQVYKCTRTYTHTRSRAFTCTYGTPHAGRAAGITFGSMVAGIMLGAGLNAWLQVDIVPIGVSSARQARQ